MPFGFGYGSTSLRADIVAVGEPVCTRVLRYRRTLRRMVTVSAIVGAEE